MKEHLNKGSTASKHEVVADDLLKLWEVPAIPFFNSHRKSVDIFIHLIEKSNRLNDHVVRTSRIEFNLLIRTRFLKNYITQFKVYGCLGSRVRVTQSQLRLLQ